LKFFEIYFNFSSTSLFFNQTNLAVTMYKTTFFQIVFIYFILASSKSTFLFILLIMGLIMWIRIGWRCTPYFIIWRIIWIFFLRKSCEIIWSIWNKIRWNMFEKSKTKAWSWELNCKCIRIDKPIWYNLRLFRFKTFLNILLIN